MEKRERIIPIGATESERSEAVIHKLRAVVSGLSTIDFVLRKNPAQSELQELLRLCQNSLNEMIDQLGEALPKESAKLSKESEA
jgi:hypothetical protein